MLVKEYLPGTEGADTAGQFSNSHLSILNHLQPPRKTPGEEDERPWPELAGLALLQHTPKNSGSNAKNFTAGAEQTRALGALFIPTLPKFFLPNAELPHV